MENDACIMTERTLISTRNILLLDLLLVGGMAAAAALTISPLAAGSVVAGGTLATASFLLLARDVRRLFRGDRIAQARGLFLVKYYARLALVAAVLYGIIKYRLVDVIGLVAGLSCIVASILVLAILAARTSRCAV